MKKSRSHSVRSKWLRLLPGLLGLIAASRLSAQTYTITELPLQAGHTESAAYAINESGQVGGHSGNRATIWTNGVPRDIQTLAALTSVVRALDDSGQATGEAPGGVGSNVFFWNGSTMTRIVPPAGQSRLHSVSGLNNLGTVVGAGGSTNAFQWNGGVFQSLQTLAGDASAAPTAINAYGIIVGYSVGTSLRPVSWTGLSPQVLALPENAVSGAAFGLNDQGEVVGWYRQPGFNRKPFIWSPGFGARALPMPPGTTDAPAAGINSAGVVIGYADSQPVVWRKSASGAYEAVYLVPLLTNGAGWTGIALWAINDAGQIAGTGRFNGQWRGFVLTPGSSLSVGLRTDVDRSGAISFDEPGDTTAPGRPFYFWTNDDHDTTGSELDSGSADSADNRIMTPRVVDGMEVAPPNPGRDLEDFARLTLQLTPELQTALAAGATLELEARGAGTIHLFYTPSSETETHYLTDAAYAASLVNNPATNFMLPAANPSENVTVWSGLELRIAPSDRDNGQMRFLWEGVTPGACVLTMKAKLASGAEVVSAPVHVSLRPVRDFFTGVGVTPSEGFPPPWNTNGQTPALGWQTLHAQAIVPPGEQDIDLVWVHGWRLTEYERQNWGEMMFKRLWHAGYRGRMRSFTWPTLSGDDFILKAGPAGFLSFDRSEFRAWKSGAALDSYLGQLRLQHPNGRLALVAHSMGNIVTGEALRRGARADVQIMMQAAISAGCYDSRSILTDFGLMEKDEKHPTPDMAANLGYRGFLESVTVPTINCFNNVDFAMGLWYLNQETKPDNPIGKGDYDYIDDQPGLYSGKKLLRAVTDVHESLAFISRSRTLPVGSQSLTGRTASGLSLGVFLPPTDLQQTYGFTNRADEHSAQFNRPIQRQLIGFYGAIQRAASLP